MIKPVVWIIIISFALSAGAYALLLPMIYYNERGMHTWTYNIRVAAVYLAFWAVLFGVIYGGYFLVKKFL